MAEAAADSASALGLREGAELSPEELTEALRSGERELAVSRSLHFLGYRARSKEEVRERLRRWGHGEEAVEAAVGRLEELGYLDDEEFARSMARQRSGKYGPRRVSEDLCKSGVAPEIAYRAVEREFEGRSELEEADSAAARRYNTGEGSDALARRVHGFLRRRGYSAEVCAEVARQYLSSEARE